MNIGVQKEYFSHIRDYDFETVCGTIGDTFPEEYEIPRGNTGTLKDQGNVGACVACTIAQIAEHWYSKQLKDSLEMSEGFIYGALRKKDSKGEGMIVSVALDLWRRVGTLPKKYFDVLREMPEIKKVVEKFPEFYDLASKYKLSGYVPLNYGNTKRDKAIKEALTKYQYGLVAVSDDGFSGGGHCIQLTGWNDKKGTYKYKNSWGDTFGDHGFAEISKKKIDRVYLPLFEEVTMPFTDVKKDDWFYDDVKAMYFAGLIKGTSETTFEPNKPLTRAEACALFNRINKEIDKRFDVMNKLLDDNIKN